MIPGYELTELLTGDEFFRLYRGRRLRDGARVLLKAPCHEPVRAADGAAVRRESEIVAALSFGSMLQPVVHELQHGCALVLEDPGGALLSSLIAAGRPDCGVALAIGIGLTTSLEELHRRGMIHNGIRPDAILCGDNGASPWLIDFGDVGGTAPGAPVTPLQLTSPRRLSYISPEQTGRMNREPDCRSDFYSLGVVLYELLTGARPFQSTDALELIHWHIARVPRAPAEVNAQIPEVVSRLVMKLLAKTAEERYRSALGLREDLEACARDWAGHRTSVLFPLGRRDVWDHFLISQKLYGREQEVAGLLDAFDRVCRGRPSRPSMMLVAGYAGIGKTSLIQELYKPIVRQRGYFISGKFDQVVRNIPFGALIQAFRALVRQLLTESEARLAARRSALVEALGVNGGVLAEVIPEIEFIIGKQAPAVALGPTEALNRFQLVFQNFVGALAQPEHPLVVFLDDLQWADPATLSLLEPLLTGQHIQSLFLMGAYRDREVEAGHPLLRTLAAL
jgi:serine/threonine protein kinase